MSGKKTPSENRATRRPAAEPLGSLLAQGFKGPEKMLRPAHPRASREPSGSAAGEIRMAH
jgi:hypothetical protein